MSEAVDDGQAFLLDRDVTVVVVPAVGGGVRYVLRDTAAHRVTMAAAFGPDSEEAAQPDESVELTDDLQVRLGIGLVSLGDHVGHPRGPVDDRRGKG